ncbi:MAG: Kdo domain containing protein [Bacteroidia bacterium]|nr:Kdo domain containing protein [Bacteroidia bacterium]
MKIVFNDTYNSLKSDVDSLIDLYDQKGEQLKDERNKLKIFIINDLKLNIKSFKIPNLLNQIVYRFFRKSKARRSFEYANRLLSIGIGTPSPIAYYENTSTLLLRESYYVSEQLEYDLTYRELTTDFKYPDHERILREFTRFTFSLHEKDIQFLDHSPGNTLIIKRKDHYDFYLVDLNRMKFGPMDFEARIQNFSRLTDHEFIIKIMSDEYAKCIGENSEVVYSLMMKYVKRFRRKFEGKKRLKKMLFFWRSKQKSS